MDKRIIIDAEVGGARPIVAGTRMRVIDALDALATSAGIDQPVADLPAARAPKSVPGINMRRKRGETSCDGNEV